MGEPNGITRPPDPTPRQRQLADNYVHEYRPKDPEKYARVRKALLAAPSEMLFKFTLPMYLLDESYDRQDLLMALGYVERLRGWHA